VVIASYLPVWELDYHLVPVSLPSLVLLVPLYGAWGNLAFAVARSNLGIELTASRVYVGFPNIAQKQVNKSTLEVTSMMVTNPTDHSIQIQQNAFLHSSSIFTPTLDGFPVALFLENTEPNIKPFAYLQLPPVHSSKSTPVNIDQTVNITDMDQFSEYTKLVMNSETLRVALRGRTVLHLGRLPATSVDYNEVLTFQGIIFLMDLCDLVLNPYG